MLDTDTLTHAHCCACTSCAEATLVAAAGAAATEFTFSMDLSKTDFDESLFNLADFKRAVREAFATWSAVANVNFTETNGGSGRSHVTVLTSDDADAFPGFDGWGERGGTIGVGGTNSNGKFAWQDAAEMWKPFGEGRGVNYFNVATHEIGHALGLSHNENGLQIMNSTLTGRLEGIYDGDIAAIIARYDAREWTNDSENIFMKHVQVGQTVDAKGGNDTVTGTSKNDTIYGGAGDDEITASEGNDNIYDTLGSNVVDAGDDNDVVVGGSGRTDAQGGNGSDILIGGKNDDKLDGGDGNDTIRGDAQSGFFHGDDVIIAGRGNDFLEGGGGSDTFVFRPNEGTNTIAELSISGTNPGSTRAIGVDFESGIDVIDLRAFGFINAEDAFDNVTQQAGDHARFSHDGTVIVFHGLDLSDLSQNDFLI